MRFNTPEEVRAWSDLAVLREHKAHLENGVDLNPFSTDGARNDWRRGFDGKPPRPFENKAVQDFDTIYQRGRAMARLLARLEA